MDKLTKLHRSRKHRMVAGVMGGIAEYLGWSPTMTRLLFVIISTASAAVPGILIVATDAKCHRQILSIRLECQTDKSQAINKITDISIKK